MNINIHFTSTIEEIQTYKKEYQELCTLQYDNLGVLNQWEYFQALLTTHNTKNFTLAFLRDTSNDNTLIGIFPMRIVTAHFPNTPKTLKIAVYYGAVYYPYIEYIIHCDYKKVVWKSFLDTVQSYYSLDGIVLGPLHETSMNYTHLLETLPQENYTKISNKTIYQINPHLINYEEYFQTRSSMTIKAAKRYRKQLEKKGNLEIKTQSDTKEAKKSLQFHIEMMKERFQEDILYDNPEELETLFLQMIHSANTQNIESSVKIIDLLFDGEIIASIITLEYRGRIFFMLTAYDTQYKKYAPGKILLNYIVEQSFQEKKILCLGAGNFGYKKLWSTQVHSIHLFTYFFNQEAKELWSPYCNLKYLGGLIRGS